MSENIRLDLEENSKFRVAFELMNLIAGLEDGPELGTEREYYLRLYRQCFEAVRCHRSIEDVVKPKMPSPSTGLSW